MTRRDTAFYDALRELQTAGWDASKENSIEFNSGSETLVHRIGKTIAAHIGLEYGYNVCSEVAHPSQGEIDLLLWGNPERLTYAVEIEHSPTEEIKQDKLQRYVQSNSVIDDMIVINANKIAEDYTEAHRFIQQVMFA
jgi:hypothetical protein